MTNLLVNELGATVEVDESPVRFATPERLELAKARARLRTQIVSCHACPLRDSGWVREPVPFDGPLEPELVVVGEAPGQNEDRAGRPFVGPAGQLMREMLRDAGFDDRNVMWMNRVSCFPHGTPQDYPIKMCSKNFEDQLAISGCRHVVLAGNIALQALRPDLTVTKSNGRVFVRDGRVFMPVLHPAYVLRNGRQSRYRAWVVEGLAKMRDLVKGEAATSWFYGDECSAVGCGEWVNHHDPEGVGWCERHWDTRVQTWTEKERDRRVMVARKRVEAKKRVNARKQRGDDMSGLGADTGGADSAD